ncbi:MAG: response regulator transcription factor [Candidatus Cloacimonetes bacterium]|nr:response regulator transcription factor [Candidatus Cloacimonadota bacterium]
MKEKLIFIVDDEPDILELVDLNLKKAGFRTKKFEDTIDLISQIEMTPPSLIILDLMLPHTDGMELCKQLKANREYRHIPIIMLTAKTDEMDKVLGLELGADDYVTKPFSPRELTARVKAVLRRKVEVENDIRTVGNLLTLDLNQYNVTVEGKKITLTNTELKILQLLTSHIGWVFSRDQILDYLWGHEKIVIDRTIDVHINHLRKKLGKAGHLIHNVRGIGYKIEDRTE